MEKRRDDTYQSCAYLKTVIHHQKGWLTINRRDNLTLPLWGWKHEAPLSLTGLHIWLQDPSYATGPRSRSVTGWSYRLKLREVGGGAFVEVCGAGRGTIAAWTSVSVPLSGSWAFVCPKCWQADMDMADYSEALDPAYTTLEFENMQVLPLGTGECAHTRGCRWTLRLLLI